MIRLKITSVLLLCLQICFGQEVTIHFKGKVYNDKNGSIGGANIQVLQDAFLPSSMQADVDGNYNLYLPLNREFDITITKEGYVQKKYFVSTKGIKEDQQMAKLPDYVADVVLFTRYDGINYSLFDQPINKYHYNPKNNNIDYDEAYLKEIKAAMKEIKKEEREAIKLAHAKLVAERKLLASSKVGYVPQPGIAASNPVATKNIENNGVAEMNAVVKKEVTDARVIALLAKYKLGVTEEIIEGKDVYIVQRVLVTESDVWIYQKKIFNWGGVACFRDKTLITEGIFEQETR